MSDEHYTDTETDEDEQDEDEQDDTEYSGVKKYKNITTEGSLTDLGYDPKLGVMQCELCGKFFPPSILVMIDPLQCFHCFFFMNYGNKSIINGQNGVTVQNYINMCSKDHKTPCARLADGSCNCYICAHNLGFPLDGVLIDNPNSKSSTDVVEETEQDCKIDDIGEDVLGNTERVVIVL